MVPDGPELTAWISTTREVVRAAFGAPSSQLTDLDQAARPGSAVLYSTGGETHGFNAQQALRRERLSATLQGFIEVLSLNLGDTDSASNQQAILDVADIAGRLEFLADEKLEKICKRDLNELGQSLSSECWKAALLLCGSILEAVLLDVVGRRSDLAAPYRKKWSFPDDASLGDLIAIAGDFDLLSTTAKGLAGTITEHRDLIHPRAEARGGMKVDKTTARALAHVLDIVTRDLADAEARGAIDAFMNK